MFVHKKMSWLLVMMRSKEWILTNVDWLIYAALSIFMSWFHAALCLQTKQCPHSCPTYITWASFIIWSCVFHLWLVPKLVSSTKECMMVLIAFLICLVLTRLPTVD
uniref:Uncharacterized protein n=1 Tax=Clandestinovirus TaxID=2831644 RepID=A0A8F8KRQ3_9VIRU|nr:hypothetical protein KOM_12_499 [Clandestinovirus]